MGKEFSGTTIKDTWTKSRGVCGSKGGRWVWLGLGGVVVGVHTDNCN